MQYKYSKRYNINDEDLDKMGEDKWELTHFFEDRKENMVYMFRKSIIIIK